MVTIHEEGCGGSGTANKDVQFVVTKRTEDDFSLLSYTVHCYPGIEFVSWCSIPYAGKANNESLFTNSTQWAGTNTVNHMHYIVAELDFSLH